MTPALQFLFYFPFLKRMTEVRFFKIILIYLNAPKRFLCVDLIYAFF